MYDVRVYIYIYMYMFLSFLYNAIGIIPLVAWPLVFPILIGI